MGKGDGMAQSVEHMIFFDCDGVLIETADIKTTTFKAIFSEYPQHMAAIVAHHVRYAGISRYEKFRHIYKHILKKPLSDAQCDALGKMFSKEVVTQVLQAPLVPGVHEFLRQHRGKQPMIVISGTPQEELQHILEERGLSSYFDHIIGSPTKKSDAMRMLLTDAGLTADAAVMIGDGESDRVSAKEVGVPFIGRITNENHELFCELPYLMEDLTLLDKLLDEVWRQ